MLFDEMIKWKKMSDYSAKTEIQFFKKSKREKISKDFILPAHVDTSEVRANTKILTKFTMTPSQCF